MIKLSFCLRRLPGMSLEQFQDYWRNRHGPLVREHADALRIRRYCQVHRMHNAESAGLSASRGGPEPYDGIAEVWWDDLATLQEALTRPEAAAASQALLDDEKKFIDLASSPLWLSEEHVILDRS